MKSEFDWQLHYAGDQCLVLEFGQSIQKSLVDQIVLLDARINDAMQAGELPGITETIPTFRSLALIYDPQVTRPQPLLDRIRALSSSSATAARNENVNHWQIPVHYGEQSGPDLGDVAEMTGLSEQRVIELHQQTSFTVYMLGFLPGFAFLGDTPADLHLPRRTEPRLRVPAGSVAIAMQLTGVYPWDSPGGWHILGNCPAPLFNPDQAQPTLFRAGDTVNFRAIAHDEHLAIARQVQSHDFDRESLRCTAPVTGAESL